MKKLILRILMPSADKMAEAVADAVAKFVNGSGRQEVIEKYSTYADEFTKVQAKVTGWLRDGKVSDEERDELKRALLPLAEKLLEAV